MRGSLGGPSVAGLEAWAGWIVAGAPCSGPAAAAAATRLRLAAALLPILPAAQQLLSLHSVHASSTWAHPAARPGPGSGYGSPPPAAAAAPQLAHRGGFSSSGSGPSRHRYAAVGCPGSAAQQLVSLRAFRGTEAEQQRMWGGHWDKRHIYASSRTDALGVVVSCSSDVNSVLCCRPCQLDPCYCCCNCSYQSAAVCGVTSWHAACRLPPSS